MMQSAVGVLSALFVVAASTMPQAAELHLRRECQANAALVTLGDVAEIYARGAVETTRLAAIELFPAPSAGQSRTVRLREIQDLLTRRGVDLRRARLAGSSAVQVFGPRKDAAASRLTSSSSLKRTVEARLEDDSPHRADHDPARQADVVAPVRPLARGAIVQASDVRIQAGAGKVATANAISSIEQVIGLEATRPLPAGRALQQDDLRPPLLVTRNSIVTVFARTRGIQVRTSAKATEDGAREELIKVQSLLDREEQFIARVVGPKEVEVFAGPPRIESSLPGAEQLETDDRDHHRRGAAQRQSLFGLRVRGGDRR